MRHPHSLLATALLSGAILVSAAPASAQSLGRLFFSPEKRAALDRQRQLNLTQARDAGDDSVTLTVNGVIQRSSGRNTTWVNGTAIDENTALPGTPISTANKTSGKVGVGQRQLKVGESLNQATGEQEDLLRGGQIQSRPGR